MRDLIQTSMKKAFILLVAVLASVLIWAESNTRQVTVYSRPNGGYVMVDAQGDIIGFSDKTYAQDISAYIQDAFKDMGMDIQSTPQVAPQHIEAILTAEVIDSIGPLLGGIEFDQGAPYNNMAPVVGGKRCVAGCVAVAMAQIMTYYQHPQNGCKGSISYKTATLNKTINVNMEDERFDWKNILPTYKEDYTEEQAAAVAKLVYYCGVAAHMDYNVGGSGTNSDYVVSALYAHFDYDVKLRRVYRDGDGYTDSEWHELLQSELKVKCPFYMSSQQQEGSGHAYVCDGYKIIKGMEKYPYYHMNWGWNGQLDGWFMLNRLRPGEDNPEGFTDLSFNQSIIYNIRPNGYTPIENVVVTRPENDVTYDILGRRVNEMKAGNIYIRNGKKFVAE